MHDGGFTPGAGAIGGALIALSLAGMLVANGRIAGLSGVCAGLIGKRGDRLWRVWFVAGMLAVGAAFELVRPSTYDAAARVPVGAVAVAGALVGVGTRLANGCTSGHGLYGIARLSKRSIVATLTFMAVGGVTATLVGWWL
jgi:uncharacterized membrane protein YedE/YeeE